MNKLNKYDKILLMGLLVLSSISFKGLFSQIDSQDTWFWIDLSESLRFVFISCVFLIKLPKKVFTWSYLIAMVLKLLGFFQDYAPLIEDKYDKPIGVGIIIFSIISFVFLSKEIIEPLLDNKRENDYI